MSHMPLLLHVDDHPSFRANFKLASAEDETALQRELTMLVKSVEDTPLGVYLSSRTPVPETLQGLNDLADSIMARLDVLAPPPNALLCPKDFGFSYPRDQHQYSEKGLCLLPNPTFPVFSALVLRDWVERETNTFLNSNHEAHEYMEKKKALEKKQKSLEGCQDRDFVKKELGPLKDKLRKIGTKLPSEIKDRLDHPEKHWEGLCKSYLGENVVLPSLSKGTMHINLENYLEKAPKVSRKP